MADTDRIAIVRLGPGDAPAGLALSAEARWNQNEADWRYFLTRGTVFGMRDATRHLVATAALLPYASGNAWVSMVLVTESWRRRGLATKLLDACLDAAARLGLTTWLDATPAGATVYSRLGFTPTIQLRRLRLERTSILRSSKLRDGELGAFATRDIHAMGFDRRDFLDELGHRPGSRLVSNGEAMALVRDGRTARHIGPLFAESAADALALVHDIAASENAPLLIDAVASHEPFLKGLIDMDWAVERPFQRMRLGRATSEPAELPFAVAGPEYG
jgi:GNAT superfamily N-acetyltransferase